MREETDHLIQFIDSFLGESAKFRDKAVEHGLITALLNLFRQQHSFEFLRNIAWLVANLCRHVEPPISLDVVRQILPIFIYFLSNTDRMVRRSSEKQIFRKFFSFLGILSDSSRHNLGFGLSSQ